jgi:single-strand DNA-binding protein
MHKGNGMMVEGRITTRSWEGQDGKKNYRTEIVGENFQFGPKGGSGAPSAPSSAGADSADVPEVDTIEYPTDDLNPNDIPF